MGAYEGLSHYFEQPLCDCAINLGYDESNILILKGQMDQLQNRHLTTYNNLLSCRHHSDRRTPLKYGQDLVASWLFEDYFLFEMQNDEFEIQHAGADVARLILPNQRTSTSSDYIITTNSGTQIHMELVNDYTGFWYKNQKLHLRDNKLKIFYLNSTARLCGGIYLYIVDIYSFILVCYICPSFWQQ